MLLRRADSYGIWTNVDGDSGKREVDYLHCAHCDLSFEVIPGSGHKRSFCTLCARATCGALACQPCVPYMKKLEAEEKAINAAIQRQAFLDAIAIEQGNWSQPPAPKG